MSLSMALMWGVVFGAILFNMWFVWGVYFYSGKQTR